MKLATRTVVGTCALVLAVGLALAGAVSLLVGAQLRQEIHKRGAFLAETLARSAVSPTLTGNVLGLQLIANDAREADRDLVYIFFVGAEGRVIAHTFEGGFPRELANVNRPRWREDTRRQDILTEEVLVSDYAAPIAEGRLGAVHVGLSNRPLEEEMRQLYLLTAGVTGGILLVATFGAVFVARIIVHPLVEMTVAADRVGAGRLDLRVPVHGGGEIGRLAVAFNAMIDKRKQAEDALQRAHGDLELLVAARTAALAEANEQLHDHSAHLQLARERERTRIARELHDELGQSITAIRMELALLRRELAAEGSQGLEQVDSLSALVAGTSEAVKRISHDLRPGVLDHLGVSAAIEWQAEEFERHTGISCSVTVEPGDIVLDEDRSTALFRICQEALTNVARHAQAQSAEVLFRSDGDGLTLQVRDDGRGIDGRGDPTKSFGILGMQERVREWGGTVDIEGIRAKGTTVTVRLPSALEGVSP